MRARQLLEAFAEGSILPLFCREAEAEGLRVLHGGIREPGWLPNLTARAAVRAGVVGDVNELHLPGASFRMVETLTPAPKFGGNSVEDTPRPLQEDERGVRGPEEPVPGWIPAQGVILMPNVSLLGGEHLLIHREGLFPTGKGPTGRLRLDLPSVSAPWEEGLLKTAGWELQPSLIGALRVGPVTLWLMPPLTMGEFVGWGRGAAASMLAELFNGVVAATRSRPPMPRETAWAMERAAGGGAWEESEPERAPRLQGEAVPRATEVGRVEVVETWLSAAREHAQRRMDTTHAARRVVWLQGELEDLTECMRLLETGEGLLTPQRAMEEWRAVIAEGLAVQVAVRKNTTIEVAFPGWLLRITEEDASGPLSRDVQLGQPLPGFYRTRPGQLTVAHNGADVTVWTPNGTDRFEHGHVLTGGAVCFGLTDMETQRNIAEVNLLWLTSPLRYMRWWRNFLTQVSPGHRQVWALSDYLGREQPREEG